jgi:hypothetical protein
LDKVFVFFLARTYVEEIAEVFDLNQHFATAISLIVFAAIVVLARYAFSLSKLNRRIGIAGLLALLVAHSVVLWRGSANTLIDRSGKAAKCYVITRESVIYRERAGFDPATGQECKPITPELVGRLREYERGKRPSRIDSSVPVFFDSGTGNPIVWFYRDKNDVIELFDLMGFHPDSGDALAPVSKQVVELWKSQNAERKALEARRPPRRIDPSSYSPFDPITGEARIWIYRADAGEYEFYDRPGYHPQTGEALKVVTREVLEDWRKLQAERAKKKCYVITREGVRYGDAPGIDQATGRQCRELTEQMLERLREYEKGRRPSKVVASDPTFFDPATGAPIVWYLKTAGQIELFDLMGFHPTTGEELVPITKEIAQEWNDQRRKRVPNRVVIKADTRFFDPMNGRPLLWYWRSEAGEYEFFDGEGFHPRNGDVLKPFTRDALRSYETYIREREEQVRKEQERLRAQQEQEARKKAEREAQEQDQARIRETERQKTAEAVRRCDELAANPNDPKRVGEGVGFGVLRGQAQEAIANCELAIKQSPTELRLKYQLARALQWVDSKRAFQLHQELVNRGYPAAFDNLGWLIYIEKKDPAQAVALFRRGIQASDSDSMVSLAEMIDRKHTVPGGPSEEKLELYRRAAELGNGAAIRGYQDQVTKEEVAQTDRIQQLEQQRMMLQFMGTVIQNMGRR